MRNIYHFSILIKNSKTVYSFLKVCLCSFCYLQLKSFCLFLALILSLLPFCFLATIERNCFIKPQNQLHFIHTICPIVWDRTIQFLASSRMPERLMDVFLFPIAEKQSPRADCQKLVQSKRKMSTFSHLSFNASYVPFYPCLPSITRAVSEKKTHTTQWCMTGSQPLFFKLWFE